MKVLQAFSESLLFLISHLFLLEDSYKVGDGDEEKCPPPPPLHSLVGLSLSP
jgi:hypothetical protein